MSSRTWLRVQWERLRAVPGGKLLLSKALGLYVPYTGSVDPRIEDLGPGYAKVSMKERRVRNHLRSVHAIALANLAELTGNLAMMYAMPATARFIVTHFSIEYLSEGPRHHHRRVPLRRASDRGEARVREPRRAARQGGRDGRHRGREESRRPRQFGRARGVMGGDARASSETGGHPEGGRPLDGHPHPPLGLLHMARDPPRRVRPASQTR